MEVEILRIGGYYEFDVKSGPRLTETDLKPGWFIREVLVESAELNTR